MHPVVRALGRVLQLVGISSPEDAAAKQEIVGGPPSWRKAKPSVGVPAAVETEDSDSKQKTD